MSQDLWRNVDAYIDEKLVGADSALEAALDANSAGGLPAIDVSPSQGKLLYLLAKMNGSRRVLEIGTLGGYSAIWLARALPKDGRLVTLERDPKHAEVARANLARAGLADMAEVQTGDALDLLPKLKGPFDFFFIDAHKDDYPHHVQWALKLARPGSVMVFDNVIRDGKVIDAKTSDASVRGVRRLNEMIKAEPRVSATAVQTVGVKGYDGFTVAVVTG